MHMKITLTSDDKITYRPYRLGYAEILRIKEQIEELKQAGVVEDSNSEHASPISIVRQMMDEKRKEAFERIKEDQYNQRTRYNKKRARCKIYLEGDLVMVRGEPASTGQSRKLLEKYAGPYIITERLSHDRYRVSDIPETQRTQKFYEGIVAIDSIKRYDPIIEEFDRHSSSGNEEDTERQEINYRNEKNETEDIEVNSTSISLLSRGKTQKKKKIARQIPSI